MARRTHPALHHLSHVTHRSGQLAKPYLGGSQDLEQRNGELQGSHQDLNKHEGLNSGFFFPLLLSKFLPTLRLSFLSHTKWSVVLEAQATLS